MVLYGNPPDVAILMLLLILPIIALTAAIPAVKSPLVTRPFTLMAGGQDGHSGFITTPFIDHVHLGGI